MHKIFSCPNATTIFALRFSANQTNCMGRRSTQEKATRPVTRKSPWGQGGRNAGSNSNQIKKWKRNKRIQKDKKPRPMAQNLYLISELDTFQIQKEKHLAAPGNFKKNNPERDQGNQNFEFNKATQRRARRVEADLVDHLDL